jgi:hypothetical protein
VTIYFSQNQIFEKLDISSTFSKSVPEIIKYICPSSDISDRAQFSGEFRLSQNLPDISGQDRTYPTGRIYLTLGFLAYKKASRTPSASSSLFSPPTPLRWLRGDPRWPRLPSGDSWVFLGDFPPLLRINQFPYGFLHLLPPQGIALGFTPLTCALHCNNSMQVLFLGRIALYIH